MKQQICLPVALTPKKCLLIGAGAVAKQKYKVLQESGFEVCVLATSITDKSFENSKVLFKTLSIHEDNRFLQDFEMLIDASGDKALGEYLWHKRKEFGYLLNVVDMPNFCDFYFGALARYGKVNVFCSSSGASPILAQTLRDKIQKILPKSLESFAQKLLDKRKKSLSSQERAQIRAKCKKELGKVFIIGCGPNDFKSLSLKALESIELLDVALIDNLVGKEIVEFCENLGIECISVAKQKGKQSFKQEDIHLLMLKYIKEGKVVGRLKGGDPVIFGRVWEEASFLQSKGIEVEMISGISSSLCGMLESGIVPTLRGISSGVLIVSAHLRESVFHSEWLLWLKDSPYTLVVMMAYSFAEKILESARALQIDENLPAAFVSKVDSPQQKAVIGTLRDLVQMAQICDRPAILILGKVIEKSLQMPYVGKRIFINTEKKGLQ